MTAACLTWKLLPAIAVVGCAGLSASPRSPISNQDVALKQLEAIYAPKAVVDCIRTLIPAQTPCRDEIAQALLVTIDLRYADFELGFFDSHRYGTFGATVLTLGLTGGASISGGSAARVLSAIAAGITGSREAFDREVLLEHTAVALQSAMRAQRNTILKQIRDGLRKSATEYPLGAALSDLYAYFRAGTLVGALTGVNEAVATQAEIARERLGTISPIAMTPSAVDLFNQYQGLPVAERQAFVRKVEGIMGTLGIRGTAMQVIFEPLREADRQAVAARLARP